MKSKETDSKAEVKISGLSELVDIVAGMQAEIDMLNSFVEEVLIMSLMPENVRYYFEDRFDGRAAEALEAFGKRMYEYRKILEFLRLNNIDVNQILSDTESKTLS